MKISALSLFHKGQAYFYRFKQVLIDLEFKMLEIHGQSDAFQTFNQ